VAKTICGVDVDSLSLEVRIGPEGPSRTFRNTTKGIAQLAAFCQDHKVELVAMEGSGGYEKQAFAQLWASGFPVAVLNPRSVRRFAQAMGLLEKTDKIDAGVIAWYAGVKGAVAQKPLAPAHEHLKALVTRLRQLTDLQTAQRQQRLLVSDATVRATFSKLLALVAAQIRQLETEITALIAADPLWHKLDQSFRSIKGVADRTVARLMAEMPEIGTLSNKAISKLAGLAPLADDSGKHQGKRRIRGGRSGIRNLLFIIATVVRRYHPDFLAFHQRLCAAGKPKKVILIALAHKLLVRLNAKAREVRQQITLEANHSGMSAAIAS
jgi:transposase